MDRTDEKELIRKHFYETDQNYEIKKWSNNPWCVIFISSAGLDLTTKVFYEWETLSKRKEIRSKFGKCIFLRDPFSSFYAEGINKNINCIDSIVAFLQSETAGYRVVISGYSAGAYLALILGSCMKNVVRVLAFSAVVYLYEWKEENGISCIKNNVHLFSHLNEENYSKYFNIRDRVNDISCRTLYFYPSSSDLDIIQKEIIVGQCNNFITCIGILSNKHSLTVKHINHIQLLCSDDKHIDKIRNKFHMVQNLKPLKFTLFNLGIVLYIKEQVLRSCRVTKRFFVHLFKKF